MIEKESRDPYHPIRAGLHALADKLIFHHFWEYRPKDFIRETGYEIKRLIPKMDRMQKVARNKFVAFLESIEGLSSGRPSSEPPFTLIRRYARVGDSLDLAEPILAGTIIKIRNFSIHEDGTESEWLITDTMNSGPNYYWISDKRDNNGNPIIIALDYIFDFKPPITSHWFGPITKHTEGRFTVKRELGGISLGNHFWDGRRTEIEVYSQGSGSKQRRRSPRTGRTMALPPKYIPGTAPVPI
jgi:hypothetical protein